MSSTTHDRPVPPAEQRRPGRTAAVELRVHGVGGSTPEGLLGVASAADTIRVGGGPISAFWARRDDGCVEGHVWGGLTAQSTFQPLWLLLLPLTLLNIAGFMHRGERTAWPVVLQRRTLRLLSYALTAAWALWTSTIVVEQLAWRGLPGLSPVARVALGTAGCLALLWVGFLVARHTTKEFEGVAPPQAVRDRPPGPGQRYLLQDRDFFSAPSAHEEAQRAQANGEAASAPVGWMATWTAQEIVRHVALAIAVILLAGGRALSRVLGVGGSPDEPLGIGALVVPALAVQLALLAVLAVASAAETLPRDRVSWSRRADQGPGAFDPRLAPLARHRGAVRRWLGPFGAASLAVGLTQLSFGGVAVFAGNRLGLDAELAASTGMPLANAAARPEQAVADVVGLAIVVAVLGALLLVAWHYPPRPRDLPAWEARPTRPHGR